MLDTLFYIMSFSTYKTLFSILVSDTKITRTVTSVFLFFKLGEFMGKMLFLVAIPEDTFT